MKELSPQYLSEFCRELALLLRAGVPISDSLLIMRDDDNDKASRELLDSLYRSAENETLLSCAIKDSGCFPNYLLSTVCLGERSGKLDESLFSLSVYYDRRAMLTENIRRAVIYPIMLLILMAAVVIVLVTQVLPIFNDVFAQVGAQMSGFSITLMNFGKWLSSASTLILTVLVVILIIGLIIYKVPSANKVVSKCFDRYFGNRGVLRHISISQFAMAMSMAISSGLDPEQAISLAGDVCGNSYHMRKKVADCKKYLAEGNSLEGSLSKSRIFSRRDSRLLALGAKTGSTDQVMSEIASRVEDKVIDELDDKLKKIEPALVIIISLVVGGILLSVMLPLMGIMSSIG